MYREIDENFVEDNYGLVISYMNKRNLDIDDWHGVVSEAYLRAIKNYDERKGKLSTYFYIVADNAVNQERRRLMIKSGPEVVDGYYIEGLDSGGSTIDDYEVELDGLLSLLSDFDVKAVGLIDEGYTHSEIGEMTGMARSSVSSRMRRLRKRLKSEGFGW